MQIKGEYITSSIIGEHDNNERKLRPEKFKSFKNFETNNDRCNQKTIKQALADFSEFIMTTFTCVKCLNPNIGKNRRGARTLKPAKQYLLFCSC